MIGIAATMAEHAEIFVAFLGLIGCVVTAALTYMATSRQVRSEEKKRADQAAAEMQRSINDSFTLLIGSLQEERMSLRKEIVQMKQELRVLSTHVLRLEAELVALGKSVPERPEMTG